MKLLDRNEIAHALSKHQGWRISDGALCRVFDFHTFAESIRFVNRIAEFSEILDHHPDIDIRFTKVSLTLTTKSENGITQKDIDWVERWSRYHG
jgi:4a-hydroxytetrahydrobiopterin dehydratase